MFTQSAKVVRSTMRPSSTLMHTHRCELLRASLPAKQRQVAKARIGSNLLNWCAERDSISMRTFTMSICRLSFAYRNKAHVFRIRRVMNVVCRIAVALGCPISVRSMVSLANRSHSEAGSISEYEISRPPLTSIYLHHRRRRVPQQPAPVSSAGTKHRRNSYVPLPENVSTLRIHGMVWMLVIK